MRVRFSRNSGASVLMRVGSLSTHHPQQSVLYPHSGQRQTACIRYISAVPQRSQITLSSSLSGPVAGIRILGGSSGGCSGMAAIIGCEGPPRTMVVDVQTSRGSQ